MIIRPFKAQIESVDDIGNILNAKRFIVLYKYKTPKQRVYMETPSELFLGENNRYGVYLMNLSTIDGSDYIIPSKFMVHVRNAYTGHCIAPLLPNGKLNMDSMVTFELGSYSNRVHSKSVPDLCETSFNTMQSYNTDFMSEAELQSMLRTNFCVPFPTYYNIEEQCRLATSAYKELDFVQDYNEVPVYRLGDLIDSKTTVVVEQVDGDTDNLFGNFDTDIIKFANKDNVDISGIKGVVYQLFIGCFEMMMDSIFSEGCFIFDLQAGTFNAPPSSFKLKYKYGMNRETIKQSYGQVVDGINVAIENVFESYYESDDGPGPITLPQYYNGGHGAVFDLMPEKLYVYTSVTTCSLKLECKSLYGMNKKEYTFHMNICATSDTDEASQFDWQDGCRY